MRKVIPMFGVGHKCHSWTVLKVTIHNKRPAYVCECVCGEVKTIDKTNLHSGKSMSCNKGSCRKPTSTTHGLTEHPLYSVWCSMKYRTAHPVGSNACYVGVCVVDEWLDFNNFYQWATANGYAAGLSIDRVKRTGNYSPDNCRWATDTVQSQNRGVTKRKAGSKYKGVYKTKPRNGSKLYGNTGGTPYYFIVIYNGKRHQKWGYATEEEAYSARKQFIKEHYDGLVYAD